MKSYLQFHVTFISGMILFTSCSETGDPNEMIVNTWQLKEFEPASHLTMPDSVRQEIIKRTSIEYTADGTFTQKGIGKTHTGTYSLSNDARLIRYVMDKTNYAFTDTIISLSSTKLKVKDQNGNKMTRVVQ